MATETWIINETFDAYDKSYDIAVSYTSGGRHFDQISFGNKSSTTYYALIYSYKDSDGIFHTVMPLNSGNWSISGYRTIIFDSPVTDANLLNWLQTRAVKKSNVSFKRYYKNTILVGSGIYKFRRYSIGTVENGYKLTLTSIHLNAGQTVSIYMNNADGTSIEASTLSDNMSWENVVSFYFTDSYADGYPMAVNGTAYVSEGELYTLTQDTTLTYDNICLTADMMVTLADGSKKQICDLTSNDMYVAYDLATGDLVNAPAKYFDAVNGHSGKFANQYQKYTFSDGTVIKEVHKHRFLNLNRMEFINLCHWEIGDRIYKIDGTTPSLVSKEIINERVEHFTVTTEKYHNGFVQGCLYGDRYSQKYEIVMVDGKPVYDMSKPHTVDYLYGEIKNED